MRIEQRELLMAVHDIDDVVRGETPAIERGSEFLASDGWKPERLNRNVVHGGCGSE